MDPYQLQNLYAFFRDGEESFRSEKSQFVLGLPIPKIASRLDSLLLVLKSCKDVTCISPWEILHPSVDVRNLEDALIIGYHDFYEKQHQKVSFSQCEQGYILDAER